MTHWTFSFCLALFAGFSLVQASPARAADVDALIERGVELRREGRDAEALDVFQQAYVASGSPRAQAQVALAHQALGRWIEAESNLTAALATDHPWISRNRAPLDQALATIRSHLAWLEVRGTPDGATVEINGRDAGALPLDEPVRVVAGDVVLRVSAEGHAPLSRTLSVRPGARAREIVKLVAAPPGSVAPAPEGPVPDAGRVLFGVPARSTVMVEAGYSALPRVTYLAPVADWFSIGVRAGLDIGLFNSMNEDYRGTLTFGAGVPVRFAVVDTDRVAVGLGLTPGLGLTALDYTGIVQSILQIPGFDFGRDLTGEYLAVLLDASLDVGFRLSRVVTVGGGVEVPAALFFGGGTDLEGLGFDLGARVTEPDQFSVVPLLIGPSVELRLAEKFALAAKVRAGPHFVSLDLARLLELDLRESRTDFALQAQLALVFGL